MNYKKKILVAIFAVNILAAVVTLFLLINSTAANESEDIQPLPIFSLLDAEKKTADWICYSEESCNAVVLTFDDGPYRKINSDRAEHTEIILDILKKENSTAAFFILGIQLDPKIVQKGETYQKYCAWIRRMSDDGHTIAVHDRNHIQYYRQNRGELDKSLLFTQEKIREITGQNPSSYLRSPGGVISREVERYLKEKGYKHVFWHINAEPGNLTDSASILNNLKKSLKIGKRGIILMHDRNASEYLLELLRFIKENQIEVISLEEWDKRYGLPRNQYANHIGLFN